MASLCIYPGRIEAAIRYADAGQMVFARGSDEVPFGAEGFLGAAYSVVGQPERLAEWCRAQLARDRDTHGITRAGLVLGLVLAGCPEEALAAAHDLIDIAEASCNPFTLSFALLTYGVAGRAADPVAALDAMRRRLVIAHESNIRSNETHLALGLSRLEAHDGDPLAALDYLTVAIRNYHDAGNTTMIGGPFAILATLFDRLGRYEPASTIAGFAVNPFTSASVPEIDTAIAHLRDILGDEIYESFARAGATMTTAAMVTYAYDQIDQARAQLLGGE
jgi:tetratricopeptide (TPR) repeat protein